MDYVRVFISTRIDVWKIGELVPKLYFWQALETSPLPSIDVSVVFILCAHDSVEGVICESVLSVLELKGEYLRCVILCINGEEFEWGLPLCMRRKS